MSNETKRYSLQTSIVLVVVCVGIVSVVSYFVAVGKQKPADSQTEKRWAGELEQAFLAFDGVSSARVEGATSRIDYAEVKPLDQQKETALKAARTASTIRQRLKLDPTVTVLVSTKGAPQYQLVYSELRGVVEEKVLEPVSVQTIDAPKPADQTP